MGENSRIEWTDHTFNPWIGCTKLSRACENCYAEPMATNRLGVAWGAGQPRRRTADSTWLQPLAWNRKAAKEGRRARVFCASLADVFDSEVPDSWRDDLFGLICATPNLDWLLLTKRPAVARKYLANEDRIGAAWCKATHKALGGADPGSAPQFPLPNVWLGTTVEDQKMAETRIPHLLEAPAAVRFVSMEPLLGEVDLRCIDTGENCFVDALTGIASVDGRGRSSCARIDWVIAGGESGPGARPSHPDWFRDLRDDCAETGVPFFFKHWGEWAPGECATREQTRTEKTADLINGEWHYDSVTPRASREGHRDDEPEMYRLGKARAGRWLDEVLHDAYPKVP